MTPEERYELLHHHLTHNVEQLRHSTTDYVSRMLSVVSAVIGCPIPPTPVLVKYIEILSEYPPDLIDRAGHHVMESHKWNNFPKLAEFIDPIKETYASRKKSIKETTTAIKTWTGIEIDPIAVIGGPRSGARGPRSLGEIASRRKPQNG